MMPAARPLDIALAFAALPFALTAQASTGAAVHVFQGGTGGVQPMGGVVRDPRGNLYGTTRLGGINGTGIIYEISPPTQSAPAGSFVPIYNFVGNAAPENTLIRAPNGTLYGTTTEGGGDFAGSVFSLTPPAHGQSTWTFATLYSFHQGGDGYTPIGRLYRTASGALYGSARLGGIRVLDDTFGVIYRLTPPAAAGSVWGYSAIYRFLGGVDGSQPGAGLIGDASGALYGTAQFGGTAGAGVIFKLTPPAAGQTAWTQTVLHDLADLTDGASPQGELALDAAGNLFGTTSSGGPDAGGTAFQLAPPAPGQAQGVFTTLFGFHTRYQTTTGWQPSGPLQPDGQGGLYGTTNYGGVGSGGVVYHLLPPAPGQTMWTETVLHSFHDRGAHADGTYPLSGVILTDSGWLIGTTEGGLNQFGNGIVFKLHP